MKKFIAWIKSPSSDFALVIIFLILANLVGSRAFFRIDLTSSKSYSLSPASKQLVRTLGEPLSVSVFFSNDLPAPYNNVAQYVRDVLVEYKGSANSNFSYNIYDMNNKQNETLATQFGLRRAQIQELKNNEVGFRQVWMGLAISYSDSIQTIDQISSTSGLEYKLTTAMAKMIATSDALAGLPEGDSISLTLYASSRLSQFGINGFNEMSDIVQDAFQNLSGSLNSAKRGRISFRQVDPPQNEIESLASKYGIQTIEWTNNNGTTQIGTVGLVMTHGDVFRVLPLSMQRSLFGYVIAGLDDIENSITGSIESLLSNSTQIGYITGHGEPSVYDAQNGAAILSNLVSDMYSLAEIDISENEIPSNVNSLIINGPKSQFTDIELYKIDQFIMRGGNVMFFVDPFIETGGDGYYQMPEYIPNETGLEKLLTSYGITTNKNYVMDEESYPIQQEGYGRMNLYWAPILQQKQLASKNPITQNLGYIIYLQAGSLDIDASKNGAAATVLASSSPKSWTVSENIQLNPMMMSPPYDKSEERAEKLAVVLEGKFISAFANAPATDSFEEGALSMQAHIAESAQPGKIFVTGTSYITGPQLIDENGTEPISMFVRNVIDYMSGNEDLCTMRTKGTSLATLSDTSSPLAFIAQYFNEFGLAILVAVAGLVVWHLRNKRRKAIRLRYNPDDTREITKASTEGGAK